MPKRGWTVERTREAERKLFARPSYSAAIRGLCACRQGGCVMCNRVIGRRHKGAAA